MWYNIRKASGLNIYSHKGYKKPRETGKWERLNTHTLIYKLQISKEFKLI